MQRSKNRAMQKTLFIFISLFFFSNSFAQKTDFSIAFNSGLFSFSGESVKESYCVANTSNNPSCYTKNPYGSKRQLCYGISAGINRVFKKNWIAGFDLGYEILKSRVRVDEVLAFDGTIYTPYFGKGKSVLTTNLINIYPYAGHRFKSGKITCDLLAGADIGCILNSEEKGSITASDGTKFNPSLNRKAIRTDIRPRIQFSINYNRAGFYVGYSYGLSNYRPGSGQYDCYTRLLRFGLCYRII